MINKLNISRLHRIITSDASVPLHCKAKWWYTDVSEKCNCKNNCKFSYYTKDDWVKYANNCYLNLCIKDSLEKKNGK